MPRPYRDVFWDSPEIMKSRNRDLKTTHITFRGYCVHFLRFFFFDQSQNNYKLTMKSYMKLHMSLKDSFPATLALKH